MKRKKITGKFKIEFNGDAFKKDFERSGMHGCKKYTKHVATMNELVDVLDRYDDFASLSLLPSDYAQSGDYGIPKLKFHRGKDRLLDHQVKATHAFLKELRGFGLLADVVGSGKTFEAGAVLSELAAKGKIESMLLIVPDQVYNTWINVLEVNFGLGKGALTTCVNFDNSLLKDRSSDGFYRPVAPIIVKMEDFVKWKPHQVEDVLFDVIVVDEAHNLCGEEGSSSVALELLSTLLVTKKKANKTYCLLLSATPHNGNLSEMFRLWYFIRCKGGIPEDFREKADEARTEDYQNEKKYYKEHICRNAETVTEFINSVKYAEIQNNYSNEFNAFLRTKQVRNFPGLLEGEKKKLYEQFLLECPEAIANKIKDNIANAYHNGVLRSIMIRQPNDNIRKGKRIENMFFFPYKGNGKPVNVTWMGNKVSFDVNNFNGSSAITASDGTKYSILEYIKEKRGNLSLRHAYADIIFHNGIFSALGVNDSSFNKIDSIKFYNLLLRTENQSGASYNSVSDNDINYTYLPYSSNVNDCKYVELTKILDKHANERVIIFFDYDIDKSKRCHDELIAALQANAKYKNRVIVGNKYNKDATIKNFDANESSILVVTDSGFTEGANLQKSCVIVNYQVTPNPLAMEQRIGRIFRLGQENDVTVYSLADMNDLEGYALAYFSNIGLMTSNSGDAAIIAGSNNDKMVTIRCNACGKVKLLSRDDYDEYVANDNHNEIYCIDTPSCRQDGPNGTKMTEINSNEFRCDTCKSVIRREGTTIGNNQYMCLAVNNDTSGVMCSEGGPDDRRIYCSKICALAHCKRFTVGPLKGRCVALNTYYKNPNVTDLELSVICSACKNADSCHPECRLNVAGVKGINACMNCSEATCFPAPHVIQFDEKWEAECPVCKSNRKKGKLKQILARTFETYIRSAYSYQQDGGAAFCSNLEKEAKKVSFIQEILSNDKASE